MTDVNVCQTNGIEGFVMECYPCFPLLVLYEQDIVSCNYAAVSIVDVDRYSDKYQSGEPKDSAIEWSPGE